MKRLLKPLFFVACLGLFITCDKSEEIFGELSDAELKSGKSHTVTVPFKADFLGEYTKIIPGPLAGCEDGYGAQVTVDFKGNATHLGEMYGSFKFCALGPENPDAQTPNRTYAPSDSYMVAANGDILFVTISGQVVTGRADDHPDYVVSYFRDPFVILGGTGRFEGATGGGWSDDYNSNLDPNSHHHWTGEITLVKGKR
jgi:hypothetical protein